MNGPDPDDPDTTAPDPGREVGSREVDDPDAARLVADDGPPTASDPATGDEPVADPASGNSSAADPAADAPPADEVPADAATADSVAAAAERLYGVAPDAFVAARDEEVAAAWEAGDRDAARAIGRLRRPTQAAWLANLLARQRADRLDGLLSLAEGLSQAQRSLDGAALRTLSSQRSKLVAAMAREARALAGRDGYRVAESTERDLRGILEAALADPAIADEVRSGRMHRTVTYSGFGPEALAGAEPRPAPPPSPRRAGPDAGDEESGAAPVTTTDPEQAERERAAQAERDRVRRKRERAEAERVLARARSDAETAADRERADAAAHGEAAHRHADARDRVGELTTALDEARTAQRAAAEDERAAAAAARESATAARKAAAEVERATHHLDDLA